MNENKPYKFPFTILTLDAETRWDRSEYTLSKMTTEEYIRDPRFHVYGMCIHEYGNERKTQWYRHDELENIFSTYDWSKTAILCQNAMFDGGILAFRYNVFPVFYLDTLCMARALRGPNAGNSLAKLAEHYGQPPKGHAVNSTEGLGTDLPAHVEAELAEYCVHDVALTEAVFGYLLHRIPAPGEASPGMFPLSELKLIDMTIKMYTQATLNLDKNMLQQALDEDNAKLSNLLERTGVEEAQLSSNIRFAALLDELGITPPTKTSKITGKEAFALAKSDAHFQALLNGEREDIALLCEARLRVKSTSERTRAQRFIDISNRGTLPIPLSYYGAATGRWSGTQQINLQNMKRGSALRKAIMAPEGYQIIAGDLSQIEPRVLAWLADYNVMLDTFRAGGDPYATFGSHMFSIPGLTKESHPLLRQSAKSALLGCLGSQTPVLTKRGWVTIVDVTTEDLLWDGVEWVAHQGLLEQGEKEVFTSRGVSATSDHEILTEHGWQEWNAVLQKPTLFQSALSLGSLPASVGNASHVKTGPDAINRECVVAVDGKGLLSEATLSADVVRAAVAAHSKRPYKQGTTPKGTSTHARTSITATGYLTVLAQSLCAAQTRLAIRTRTTADAVLQYIQSGLQTVLRSSPTLSPSMAGTGKNYNSTASTTTAGIAPATFDSLRAARTWQTSARSAQGKSSSYDDASQPLKQRMQTYDIAQAGPRNRYTIRTDEGPIIVHNCGYALGWASFAAQLLVGFLGAAPVRYTKEQAKQLGVTKQDINDFCANKVYVTKMNKIPHTCTEEELLVHCLASKAIIDKYRRAAEPVTRFWRMLGDCMVECLYGGSVHEHKGVLQFRKGEIEMVNGMCLRYPELNVRRVTDPDTGRESDSFSYFDGKMRRGLHHGILANNCVQGLARVVMSDGMLRVAKRLPVKGTVHDELLTLSRDECVQDDLLWVKEMMIQEPSWLPGIPLNADVGANKRYGLAKV